jgi:hypothetical protein
MELRIRLSCVWPYELFNDNDKEKRVLKYKLEYCHAFEDFKRKKYF